MSSEELKSKLSLYFLKKEEFEEAFSIVFSEGAREETWKNDFADLCMLYYKKTNGFTKLAVIQDDLSFIEIVEEDMKGAFKLSEWPSSNGFEIRRRAKVSLRS